MNPRDNISNLSEEYLDELAALPKRERQRFLEGKWLDDVEGALWTDQDIVNAQSKDPDTIMRSVVAIDPAVSNTSGSDECGIVICSLDNSGIGVIEDDLSGKMATTAWAKKAVESYHTYECNAIVIETNQGGDLCVDAIHNVPGGAGIKVVKVHAARGKQARAEPVQSLYEQGKVAHLDGLSDLEDELTNWVPTGTNASPNRLDALVWGLTYLMLRNTKKRIHIGAPR
jgi:phage terminase large subunit-like protein